jgi:hypothetical protein
VRGRVGTSSLWPRRHLAGTIKSAGMGAARIPRLPRLCMVRRGPNSTDQDHQTQTALPLLAGGWAGPGAALRLAVGHGGRLLRRAGGVRGAGQSLRRSTNHHVGQCRSAGSAAHPGRRAAAPRRQRCIKPNSGQRHRRAGCNRDVPTKRNAISQPHPHLDRKPDADSNPHGDDDAI